LAMKRFGRDSPGLSLAASCAVVMIATPTLMPTGPGAHDRYRAELEDIFS
jgi:hypothetical protein